MSNTSIEEIFAGAVNLPTPQERAAYLSGACGGDHSLREQVESLLDAHEENPDFMQTALAEPALTLPDRPLVEGPGTVIGRYKILQLIAEGGMGAVFMAEQTTGVHRKVALKIIKLGMDTKSVIARFEAERQALALMDHPNIAKVLDVGSTETGRPFFVMELVKGVPINDYCDRNQLPTIDRLNLFNQVCQAIQHAHQKGVIHRDIKPSNILVTLHDGKPVPKVIDFGIAKATNQRLTEKTLFTNYSQMIGTPAYMSPEQAEMSGLDVDTRTDIYSLGVLLYELLTGTTPFLEKQLLSQGYGEIQRILAEEEPERPSLRLSTLEGEQQSIVSKNRSEPPADLTKRVQGDLDWIAMKALEKDRTRRYETASSFAEDVKRHLDNEPVQAVKPSLTYQLSKLYRRKKSAVLASAAFALVLVSATVVSLTQTKIARDATQIANNATRNEAALRKEAEQQAEAAKMLAEERRLHAYVGDMKSADDEIRANNFEVARDILRRHRPTSPEQEDLRGFEWRYLWQASRDQSIRTVQCQPKSFDLYYLAVSPNNQWLAVAQGESSIRILSYPELELVHEITQKTDPGVVPSFRPAFSPDGTRFYTITHTTPITRRSNDNVWKTFSGTLNIYETTRWTKIAEEENCFPVLAVAPGGEPIFQTLKQDPETGEFTGSKSWAMLRPSGDGTYDRIPVYQNLDTNLDSTFTQSPGFNRLATKSSYNESSWKIWNTSNPTDVQLQTVIESHGFPTIDRTGRYLVTLRLEDGTTVMLHDLNEAKIIDLESPKSDNELFAMRAVFSDDGTRLIASTLDRMLHIWETKTGKHLETIPGQPEIIHAMVAVGSHVTCLYESGELRTWDTSKKHDTVFQQTTIPLLSENTYLIDWDTEQPSSDLIERIHPELRAHFEAGTLPWRLPRPISYALNRRFQARSSQHILSPNGQFIGIITYNWDYDSLEEFPESRRLKLPKGKRVGAKYEIPRTIRFYDLNDNGRLVVEWQLGLERNVPTIDLPGYSGLPQFLDDHRLIVEVNKKAELWDLRSRKRQTLSVEEPTPGKWVFGRQWADISGTSLLLAMGEPGVSGSVFLWNVDTDRQQIKFPCFGTPQFSPNGQYVLVDEWHPHQSSIFQSTTGERVHDLQGHRLPTKSFYSPDGKTILTVTDGNKQIPSRHQLWNAATGRKITQIDRDIRTDLAWEFSLDGTSLYSYEETYIYKLGLPNVEKAELHLLSLPTLEAIDVEMDAED